MKKYLMSGVAAIAFLAVVTSCSKSTDLYDQDAQNMQKELVVNKNYAAAFEKAFGTVGSNVDWGFSSKIAKVRGITRAEGDFDYTIDFPSDCDASKFLEDVPAGVNKLPEEGGSAGNYSIDASTPKVSTWSGASNIYVTGTVDLSEGDTDPAAPRFAPDYRSEIYLLKGSTLKLGEISASNLNVAAIYIAQGAKLEAAGVLKANTNTKVYNHGTISAGLFETNTTSFLYNVGTLTAKTVNVESVSGNPSIIVNDGTISATTSTVKGGAVLNNADWTVTGTTTITSNNSGWINNSHWTTNDFVYEGGSDNVINKCYLWVKNDFEINISSKVGSFKISNDGGVLTKKFFGGRKTSDGSISGPYRIIMGNRVVFKVEETATLEGGNQGQGFFGPTSGDYAVFQATNIVRNTSIANTQGAVTYGGNLYVSAETHFAQGNDGYAPNKFIYADDSFIANNIYAAGFKSGKPSINIDQTTCNPGFKGDNLYRVIAEDLTASEAGDFDFNDVVFDVVKAEGGKTTLKLICAGGVLPLRVRGANEAEGQEVHALFGGTPNEKGEYQIYNTGAGPNVDPVEFTVEGEYTTPEEIKNIIIEVNKGSWMELKATQGEAACKILVDDTFIPVRERKNIANEYGLFTNYVQGSFVNDFWWK